MLKILFALFLAVCSMLALAEEAPPTAEPSKIEPSNKVLSLDHLTIEGFADFIFADYDYPDFFYRNRYAGPQRDQRLTIALNKFSLGVTKEFNPQQGLIAELVFQHEGFRFSKDPNYLGPFNETDHDNTNTGEVRLYRLYLYHKLGDHLTFQVGRFSVAVGLMPFWKNPTDYLGTTVIESQANLIPDDWTELGVSMEFHLGFMTSTTQVVSGLDPAGFNSKVWVAEGGQGRFGDEKITDPALVQRLDFFAGKAANFGASILYGDVTRNRPIPAYMAHTCSDPNEIANSNTTAPCGYIHTPMTIIDIHSQWNWEKIRGQAMYLWGNLHNADAINTSNLVDIGNAPDYYTPVSSRAFGAALEIGYNILPTSVKKLEPFLRFDHYNSLRDGLDGTVADPVYERRMTTYGVSYIDPIYYAKMDYGHRTFGSPQIQSENTFRMATGFVF
jgi:hypothetical protein